MLIKKCIMKSKDSFLCFSFFINYGKILWVINMKISKSLFKNLSRCENMASLYDMYMYKNLHHIKEINGENIEKILVDVDLLKEGIFEEEHEKAKEIFMSMFDDETGEDLTIKRNAQLEAYAESFKEVEILAANQISELLKKEVVSNINTKEQKKFSYTDKNNEYYCYLDIYLESEDEIKIFEVKATTSSKFLEDENLFFKDSKDIYHLNTIDDFKKNRKFVNMLNRYTKTGKYLYDIAVQKHIVDESIKKNNEAFNKKINYYLVVLNSKYIFDGTYKDGKPVYSKNNMGENLFEIFDVSDIIEEYQPVILKEKERVEQNILDRKITKFIRGVHCEHKKSTECPFFKVCYSKCLDKGSVLEYIASHVAFKDPDDGTSITKFEMINDGFYKLLDVPVDYLKHEKNIIQRKSHENNEAFVSLDKIKYALSLLKYPLYHLDFETYGGVLPRYFKEKPYSQSVFQYSLHIEKAPFACDKYKDHREYLAPDHDDHREDLVRQLISDIDLTNGGTVVVYNASFEKARLKELAEVFPEHSEKLLKIREHIYDLLDVIRGNQKMFLDYTSQKYDKKEAEQHAKMYNYYHPNMRGSFSIKKVLPIFTNLSYADLEVKNGTEAVLVYSLLPTFTPEEYAQNYLSLREYCCQDTWAMVEILWGLIKIK